jgi:predicted phosphate transport protein (TIGR00153 family)
MSWKEIGRSGKIDSDYIFNKFPLACLDICKVLHEAAKAFIDSNSADVKKYAENVIECENEIDELKDKIMLMLGSARSLPYMSIDYFNLINEIEGVADRAEIAARLMRSHIPEVPSNLKELFVQLSESMVDTVQLLTEAFAALIDDYDKAWDKARLCEIARHSSVELHYEMIETIYREDMRGRDLNFVVKLTRRFALISDKAEEAADFVRLLVIKYRV